MTIIFSSNYRILLNLVLQKIDYDAMLRSAKIGTKHLSPAVIYNLHFVKALWCIVKPKIKNQEGIRKTLISCCLNDVTESIPNLLVLDVKINISSWSNYLECHKWIIIALTIVNRKYVIRKLNNSLWKYLILFFNNFILSMYKTFASVNSM